MMTPDNFLGLDEAASAFERAGVLVLPIPFEATVSYGGGAAVTATVRLVLSTISPPIMYCSRRSL